MTYSVASNQNANHFRQNRSHTTFTIETKPDLTHIAFDSDGYIHRAIRKHSVAMSRHTDTFFLNNGMYLLRQDAYGEANLLKVLQPGLLVRVDHDTALFEKLLSRVGERYDDDGILRKNISGPWRSHFTVKQGYADHFKATLTLLTGATGLNAPGVSGQFIWADHERGHTKINFNTARDQTEAWCSEANELAVYTLPLTDIGELLPYVAPGTHLQIVTKTENGVYLFGDPIEITPTNKTVKVMINPKVEFSFQNTMAINLITVKRQWIQQEMVPVIEVICFTDQEGDFLKRVANRIDASTYLPAKHHGLIETFIADLNNPELTNDYTKVNHSGINVIMVSGDQQSRLSETQAFDYQLTQDIVNKRVKLDDGRMLATIEEVMEAGFMPRVDKKLQMKFKEAQDGIDAIMQHPCNRMWMLFDHRIHPQQKSKLVPR